MNVPIAQRTVGIDAQAAPNVSIKPITEAAFGADVARSNMNIAEAKGSVGKAIGGVGQQLFEHMAAKRKVEQEQEVNDLVGKATSDMDKALYAGDNAILNTKSVNAKGASDKFIQESAAIRDTYGKGLSGEQARLYNAQMAVHVAPRLNETFRHETQQGQVAREEGAAATVDTYANTYATEPGVKDGKSILIDSAIGQMEDVYKLNGKPIDGVRTAITDEFATKSAQANINSHPERIQTILQLKDISPDTRATIQKMYEGKVFDMKSDSLISDPSIKRNLDGSPDLADVSKRVNALTTEGGIEYTQDKKDAVIKLFQQKNQEQDYILANKNKSTTNAFYAEALKPGVPLEQAKRLAVQYGDRFRNGAIDQNDVNQKLRLLDQMHREKNGTTDPQTYLNLRTGINLEGAVTLKDINDAADLGLLSKTDQRALSVFATGQKSEIMANTFKQIEDSIAPQDKKGKPDFMLALHQEVDAKKLTDPKDVRNLATEMKKSAPTGATLFWGNWNRTQDYYKSAVSVQANPDLLRALGGKAETAIALGQRIGGVDKLTKDTPESKAILALIKSGAKPEQINTASIEWVKQNKPELLK